MIASHLRSVIPLVVTAAATACAGAGTPTPSAATPAASTSDGPRIVQPGAPGQATRVITADELTEVEGAVYTEADVRFIQRMIPHHEQALEMTDLVLRRAAGEAVQQMALRMQISQRDEIGLITRWLTDRGESVRMEHDMSGGMAMIPGMLTPEQMQQLATAADDDFDRLFLELMIRHHQGAIEMVHELFSTSGAGQESLIFKFASDVDADQTMEIERMQKLLAAGLR